MAENEQAAPAEIDVDALSEAEFTELKGKIRSEQPVEAPPAAKKADPAPKPAATDKAAPDANAEEDGGEGKSAETVPHGQFHRERERRKAAEAEADTIRANYQKLMDRTTQLLQRDVAPERQEQAPAIPAWDDNPIEAGKWTQEQVLKLANERTQEAEANRQRTEQQQYWQSVIAEANNQFTEAEKADPSVREAYDSLKASYLSELKALGHSPQSAAQELERIEAQGIAYALHNRIPVAEYVVGLASARGWQRKVASVDTGKSEAEKINEREQTRLASLSLGKAGGEVVNTGITTPEQLLEMSDDEFRAYKKKHGSVAYAFAKAS